MSFGPELRFPEPTRVWFDGVKHVFFGGNDYHRLARHPEVLRAARETLDTEGLSASGSRTTTGNHPLYRQLELRAADFLGAEEATACSDGYLSNTVAVEAVAQVFQRYFVDESAHASLMVPIDGLPRDRVHRFPHAEPEGLRDALKAHLHAGERPLVLTNGVEPGDGELVPLQGYWEAVQGLGGLLLVDDAHGMGTAGTSGQGSPQEAGLPPLAFLQTGTFAKAFGAFGGLVAGGSGLLDKVLAHSRSFTGATPMAPPLAAAAWRALGLLQEHPEWITGLRTRTFRVRERLRAMGLPSCPSPVPILSVTHGNEAGNQRLKTLLLQHGIYPNFIDYPGCPPGGHFRFTLSGLHTEEEVDRLLQAIASSCV
jgi:glycine C-acetyltransferase/8-amino-7-oxononanoate synthase